MTLITDPVQYSQQGGLIKFLKEKLSSFMRNVPEYNIILVSVLLKLCRYPVRIDALDGQFLSRTAPHDITHKNLTLLHMVLFDQPLTTTQVDVFSLMSTLYHINDRVTELLRDDNIALLVSLAKQDGKMNDLSIPSLSNAWMTSTFKQNRR